MFSVLFLFFYEFFVNGLGHTYILEHFHWIGKVFTLLYEMQIFSQFCAF